MRYILANLVATFTGPRYFPEFEWSNKLWIHNVFRFFGMFFGEHYGIRANIASWNDEYGVGHEIGYTLEAQLALFEVWVRGLFKKYSPKLVLIPQLQLAGYVRGGLTPYRFAIAFENSAGQSTNSNTLSKTNTGSQIGLVGYVIGDINATDNLTGVQYNSVAMTFGVNLRYPSDRWNDLYVLGNASTGTNNMVTSGNTFNNLGACSYTGCASAPKDGTGSNDNSGSSSTTSSVTLTVGTTGDWIVATSYAPGGYGTSGGTSVRLSNVGGAGMYDTNGTVAAGSRTASVTCTSNPYIALGMAIKAPAAAIVYRGFFIAASR